MRCCSQVAVEFVFCLYLEAFLWLKERLDGRNDGPKQLFCISANDLAHYLCVWCGEEGEKVLKPTMLCYLEKSPILSSWGSRDEVMLLEAVHNSSRSRRPELLF